MSFDVTYFHGIHSREINVKCLQYFNIWAIKYEIHFKHVKDLVMCDSIVCAEVEPRMYM